MYLGTVCLLFLYIIGLQEACSPQDFIRGSCLSCLYGSYAHGNNHKYIILCITSVSIYLRLTYEPTLLTTMLPSSGLTFSLEMTSPLCSVVPSEVSTQLCWSLPRGTLSTWTIGVARPTPQMPAQWKTRNWKAHKPLKGDYLQALIFTEVAKCQISWGTLKNIDPVPFPCKKILVHAECASNQIHTR